MKIGVFGATGGTGKCLVEQALAEGHDLTALARNPEALGANAGPRVVQGDALDPAAVSQVVAGVDAVVCILGLPKGEGTSVSEGTRNICQAMQEHGVNRLVAVTVMGLGDSKDKAGFFGKVLLPYVLKKRFEDRIRQEEVVIGSGLDYTIVRPTRLEDGPRTGEYSAGPDTRTKISSRVNRADVAEFILRQLGDSTYSRQAVSIVG
jgi:uncharacterized protein YbjT (DUF2867 family)